jgi:cysteine desulfurase
LQKIYLDNAASTPLSPEVLEVMLPYFTQIYGNPSSIHAHGRQARAAIEKARKQVANLLHCSTSEVFFTSGGTEADNTAISQAVHSLGVQHIITSKLEHHAVLHTIQYLEKTANITVSYVTTDSRGNVDYDHLQSLMAWPKAGLVSLMHANNEIGTMLNIDLVAELCMQNAYLFHSDTVQSMGHYLFDLQQIKVDFLAASAHKFHGPKGVGFMYINTENKIKPYLHGGAQERNMRGGTENISGIVGLAKALELAYSSFEKDKAYILGLKKHLANALLEQIPDVEFNGNSANLDDSSLYTVLNVSFPPSEKADMLLFNLDIAGVSVSGGSACASGSDIGSHVLTALGAAPERPSVRFSFSKFNTMPEMEYVVQTIRQLVLA